MTSSAQEGDVTGSNEQKTQTRSQLVSDLVRWMGSLTFAEGDQIAREHEQTAHPNSLAAAAEKLLDDMQSEFENTVFETWISGTLASDGMLDLERLRKSVVEKKLEERLATAQLEYEEGIKECLKDDGTPKVDKVRAIWTAKYKIVIIQGLLRQERHTPQATSVSQEVKEDSEEQVADSAKEDSKDAA
ncbi:hypothetical protein H2200_005969 [Cladophialophora chaetospira]|uniref:Uncharacterized protein n=1 Tax=Cladophialophora chaetospira TaxID=386627 RepID=A0AA38XA67_9EURO|nr:hypothetical protein H2200_005969 [Cladophialophora chaetospira]